MMKKGGWRIVFFNTFGRKSVTYHADFSVGINPISPSHFRGNLQNFSMGRIAEILPQLLNLNCQLEPFEDEKFKDLRFQSPREIILFPHPII